jgi:hypothetical protein
VAGSQGKGIDVVYDVRTNQREKEDGRERTIETASQSFRDKCFGEGEKKRYRGENQNFGNKEEGKFFWVWRGIGDRGIVEEEKMEEEEKKTKTKGVRELE